MQPIKMTDEIIRDVMQEFYSQASVLGNLQTDKFSFNKSFSKPAKDAVEVNFTLEAYHEMCALIDHFSTEVAWHGLVKRLDKTHFQITKILIYPQKVTGATVNTDQEEYTKWLYALKDEEFNAVRFQGHSHVNMATNPSGVDMQNQWDMINQLNSTDYYIFMIWNKRREYNVRVIDMADNVIYSGSDVKVTIGALDMKGFLEEAEALVKKPTPVYNHGTTYGSNARTYPGGSFVGTTSTATTKSAEKTETEASNPALKTVTGAAAPKVNKGNESNLMGYYKKNPNELSANWNSSCLPYADALSN
nr:MAG TPA: hypothetical protein [Caudoviricetes sp.]